jgi:hypothetical protein
VPGTTGRVGALPIFPVLCPSFLIDTEGVISRQNLEPRRASAVKRKPRARTMSLAPTMSKTKWKWALFFGAMLGLFPTLASTSPDFRFAYILRHFAEPGIVLQILIMREWHGGGSPLETWLLIIPINIALYTLLFYGVITGISKLSPKLVMAMGTILVIIVVAILAPKIRKHNHYTVLYASLQQGTSRTEVLQKWGPPSFSRACDYIVRWDGNPIPPGIKSCVEELRYSSPITSDQWGIGFDEDGHAISKDHFISP